MTAVDATFHNALKAFQSICRTDPDLVVHAPGRVNLIGEHTDYNDCFVLPCAINYGTYVVAKQRDDQIIRVIAADFDNDVNEFSLGDVIQTSQRSPWSNYVRGVVQQILRSHSNLVGMDLAISGNVPQGAGLSSSAALEVAVGFAISQLNQLELSKSEIALIGQAAENQFVGVQCGNMDQLISAHGRANHALLIDCRSLDTELISVPTDLAVVIVDSKVQRGLVDSEYNTRRQQCDSASQQLGIKTLRDIDQATFLQRFSELEELPGKRARHVVTENVRTLEAAAALRSNDIQRLACLMAESHQSMQGDFAITIPPIDKLVEIIKAEVGSSGGVRMTGGGLEVV